MDNEFTIDEQPVPFVPGQTILEAAKAAGIYIPHLCFQPDFQRHGGCKLCTVLVNGRTQTACTHKAAVGQEVDVDTPELERDAALARADAVHRGQPFLPELREERRLPVAGARATNTRCCRRTSSNSSPTGRSTPRIPTC